MKHCELCLCKFCSKAKTECCLMCIGTPNQKPIYVCPDYNNPMAELAELRGKCGILDDYREHDAREIARIMLPLLQDKNGNPYATEENIEEILDKIFNNNESQD